MTEWQNLYFNKKLEEQQKKINEVEQQKAIQAAAIATLTEQVHQRDIAIQQIHGSLMFRTMLRVRDVATRLGMRHVLNILRRIKHGRMPQPPMAVPALGAPAPVQHEFDYEHMLSLTEYRFFTYRESRLEHYAALLSEMESSSVKDMVSVILPVYNGDDLVALSIESVLNQTYRNFEFIIVDDGSFDNTPAIVDEYAAKDSRIRVVHQKNQKLPRTLSNGFALARGEFLTWTSADNIMHPDFLQKLVDEMKKHPQTGMIYANLDLIDEKGEPLTDFGWYPDPTAPDVVRLPQCMLELNTYPDKMCIRDRGTRADCKEAIHLIDGLSAETLLADRGYDTNQIIAYAADAGMNIVIPAERNRKQQREYDRHLYRLRHLVENAFLHLKRWRGIATRYAKTTTSFLAAVQIRCIAIWCTVLT